MMCASWVCANALARLSQGCLAVAYVMNSSLTFKIPYNGSELTSWFLVNSYLSQLVPIFGQLVPDLWLNSYLPQVNSYLSQKAGQGRA